jgi:fucose 4-O-acetylase-like acetyltransferase
MSVTAETAARPGRPRSNREIYIDAFRGLMALVMVQGHVMDALLTKQALAQPWYVFQLMFHGSTAPGFLFASGFVAGLPRAPLSLRASVRRARRLLFVLGVGYFLHLPYASFWKTVGNATPSERAALLACDALQLIAVTQLFVLLLQWLAGRHWTRVAAALALVVIVVSPFVWSSGVAAHLPEAIRPYLDDQTGSRFPLFPFSAFVLAGTLAGATLGRAEPAVRHKRALLAGGGLLVLGGIVAWALEGRFAFWWGASPGYVVVRLGGLVLLMRLVEIAANAGLVGTRLLALLGHETLLVYVFHLYMLFGGLFGASPLMAWSGRLGAPGALGIVVAMLPPLAGAAWLWRAAKHRAPHEAQLALAFVSLTFVYEFFTRSW